jgi:hypothetical protein
LSLESLKSKLFGILNETVAQDIFRELKDLRANLDTHGKRWVMELIQNALDVSTEQGVNVRIDLDGKRLVFSHNGRSFTEEELIHLIYHGSTKADSEGLSGKLGTGFLATHLLSLDVRIKGTLCEKEVFDFTLDRHADSVEELTANMINSWQRLLESIHQVDVSSQRETSYEYTLDTPDKFETYQKGIHLLRESASILLSLDKRLNSITIREQGDEFVWSKKENPGSLTIDISLVHGGKSEEEAIRSLIVFANKDTTIAVPLTLKNGRLSIFDASNIPKLYYPLPLIGTTAFPFPFLISNRDFAPTTDREGVFLTNAPAEKDVIRNKQIVEIAFSLFQHIVDLLCKNDYGTLHNIARLPEMERIQGNYSNWLDKTWIEPLVQTLIERIRHSPLLLTADCLLAPKDSRIPVLITHNDTANMKDSLKKLWELSTKLFPKSTPNSESYEDWQQILSDWIIHYPPSKGETDPYAESLTIEKLSKIVEETNSLDNLQTSMNEVPVIPWLNELLALVQVMKKDTLFDTKRILPNQNRVFQTRVGLYRDSGISDELKDIALMLGRDVRSELLLNGVTNAALSNLRTEQEILLDTLRRIRNQAKTEFQQERYQKANVDLLKWLINRKLFEEIRNSYPVLSRGKDLNEEEYLYSFSAETLFLFPESEWSEDNRKYVEVFPSRAILSNIYAALGFDDWKQLAENNLIFQNLSFAQEMTLNNKQLRELSLTEIAENDGKDHRTNEKILVTLVPFLENKDWGVMDRISGKERATKFLSFVLCNLIKNDFTWKEAKNVSCICGSTHQIYPSIWLEALRSRQWVPVSGGKGEKPSSENLAPLFAESELTNLLEVDEIRRFLGILGITVSVLLTANKSSQDRREFDQAFSKLLAATGMDSRQLGQIANACADQDLREKLLDAAAEKERIQTNQKVGKLVEDLIRELIEDELSKDVYKVEKVTAGSDARISLVGEVEPDNDYLDEKGREIFIRVTNGARSHFVEIKSVRTDSARMTIPQAKQANKASNAFTLCVVEVPLDIANMPEEAAKSVVKQNARFVFPIGESLSDMVNEVEAFQRGERLLSIQQDQEMQVDVVSEAKIRIRVNQAVWRKGLDLDGFIRLIGGRESLI